jgi:hypothetical protein
MQGRLKRHTDKMVTDQHLTDIHAYLASLPRPMDAAKIPLLQGLQTQ